MLPLLLLGFKKYNDVTDNFRRSLMDKEDFTVGDLISWSFTERFLPRKKVKFVI
jgi:hypothetical protein